MTRHGPAAGPATRADRSGRAGRSVFRTLAALLLAVIAVALAVIGMAGVVDAVTGTGRSAGSGGGIAFVFIFALLTGSAARAVARGGRPGSGIQMSGNRAASMDAAPCEPRLPPGMPAADRAVRYHERCSQFPVGVTVVSAAVTGACVAGLAAIGGPNGRPAGAAGAVLLAAALIAVLVLLVAVLDLPNGIEIGAGSFRTGAGGVRPAGRLWRRVTGPLDAVRSWEVLTAEQARQLSAARRARSSSGRRPRLYLGDLRMFGRRPVLCLRVDTAVVRTRFPAHILTGYVLVPTAATGAVWDGAVLIGTRRPAALAAALEQALPTRRAFPPELPE